MTTTVWVILVTLALFACFSGVSLFLWTSWQRHLLHERGESDLLLAHLWSRFEKARAKGGLPSRQVEAFLRYLAVLTEAGPGTARSPGTTSREPTRASQGLPGPAEGQQSRSAQALPTYLALRSVGALDLEAFPSRKRASYYPPLLSLLEQNVLWTDLLYHAQLAWAYSERRHALASWVPVCAISRGLRALGEREAAFSAVQAAVKKARHPELLLELGVIQGERLQTLASVGALEEAARKGNWATALEANFQLFTCAGGLGRWATAKSHFDAFLALRRRDRRGRYAALEAKARRLLTQYSTGRPGPLAQTPP